MRIIVTERGNKLRKEMFDETLEEIKVNAKSKDLNKTRRANFLQNLKIVNRSSKLPKEIGDFLRSTFDNHENLINASKLGARQRVSLGNPLEISVRSPKIRISEAFKMKYPSYYLKKPGQGEESTRTLIFNSGSTQHLKEPSNGKDLDQSNLSGISEDFQKCQKTQNFTNTLRSTQYQNQSLQKGHNSQTNMAVTQTPYNHPSSQMQSSTSQNSMLQTRQDVGFKSLEQQFNPLSGFASSLTARFTTPYSNQFPLPTAESLHVPVGSAASLAKLAHSYANQNPSNINPSLQGLPAFGGTHNYSYYYSAACTPPPMSAASTSRNVYSPISTSISVRTQSRCASSQSHDPFIFKKEKVRFEKLLDKHAVAQSRRLEIFDLMVKRNNKIIEKNNKEFNLQRLADDGKKAVEMMSKGSGGEERMRKTQRIMFKHDKIQRYWSTTGKYSNHLAQPKHKPGKVSPQVAQMVSELSEFSPYSSRSNSHMQRTLSTKKSLA
jgi:hypothetical protein